MLAGFGLNEQKMAAAQRVTQHIKPVITADYKANQIVMQLSSDDPEAAAQIPNFIQQYVSMFAQQLSMLFAMQGKIINIGEPPAK